MVELAVGPLHRVMAGGTGRRELRAHVINRSLRVIEIVLVTGHASRHRDVVVAIDVAIRASPRWNRMRAC